jgi:small multidrug resistance pump
MKYFVALMAALVLNASANLLMKIGMKSVAQDGGVLRGGVFGAIKLVLSSAPLVIGLTCFALNAAFYMYALQSKTLKISVAYPIMVGGGFALIAVVAHVHPALLERLTAIQMVGVALILTGIILIAAQMEAVEP